MFSMRMLLLRFLAIGFLISSTAANADTYTGCLTHQGYITKIQEGPDPKRPCRQRETEITFGMGEKGEKGDQGDKGVDGMDGIITAAEILPPGGNTIAGPGSFNLAPSASVIVRQIQAGSRVCATLVVTSNDTDVELKVITSGSSVSIFVTSSSSRSLCHVNSENIEVLCGSNSIVNCTGFWRVDYIPAPT